MCAAKGALVAGAWIVGAQSVGAGRMAGLALGTSLTAPRARLIGAAAHGRRRFPKLIRRPATEQRPQDAGTDVECAVTRGKLDSRANFLLRVPEILARSNAVLSGMIQARAGQPFEKFRKHVGRAQK